MNKLTRKNLLMAAVQPLHCAVTPYDYHVAMALLCGDRMVADHHAGYPRNDPFIARLRKACAAFGRELRPGRIVPCQIIPTRKS